MCISKQTQNYLPAVFIRKIVPVYHERHWGVWVYAVTMNNGKLYGHLTLQLKYYPDFVQLNSINETCKHSRKTQGKSKLCLYLI